MAIITQDVKVVAGGFDLSCYFRSIDLAQEMNLLDSTALCTTGSRSFVTGISERTISGEGYFDQNSTTDALSIDKTFADAFSSTANKLFTVGIDGSALGDIAYLMNIKQASYSVQETVGEIIMNMFEAKATLDGSTHGWAANGVFLMSQAVTGTVNVASYDDGVGATTGYFAHCHVTADDFTNMVVKIQHSTDNSAWSDLITFTAFSGIGAQQAVNTATSINRYIRAAVTTFTGTSATVVVAIKTGYTG